MRTIPSTPSTSTLLRSTLLRGAAIAVALTLPGQARAGWGDENWGTMLWGQSVPVPVPGLEWFGLLVLALGLLATTAWTLRKRRPGLGLPVLLVLLAIPLVVAAGTLNVPNTFTNGTVADPDEVNANFGSVKAEVDDNFNRTTTNAVAAANAQSTADAAAAGHTVNTDTQLTEAQVDGFVANNGFSTGGHTVDTNTQLSGGEVLGVVANSGLFAAATVVVTAQSTADAAQATATANQTRLDTQGPHERPSFNNTAVGNSALLDNNSQGSSNTAVGVNALRNNTGGKFNTAVGNDALFTNTGGGIGSVDSRNNTAIGGNALRGNITGASNTAHGFGALVGNTTGSNNTALGLFAGQNLTTGSDNIMIGNEGVAGESDTIRIGTAGTHTTTHLTGDVQIDGASISNVATGVQTAQSTADAAQSSANDILLGLFIRGTVGVGPHDRPGTDNTSVGVNALLNNTSTGVSNTAVGVAALSDNDTGDFNTASGRSALQSNTSGSRNTASGYRALVNNNGSDNTASGYRALSSNTSGGANTASGVSALRYNTIGSSNTAIGTSALLHNIDGGGNTASGRSALRFNTSGSNNTGSGHSTLYRNTIGSNNTASGRNALFNNLDGFNNTASGRNALVSNTSGDNNTAIGRSALSNSTTGSNNIGVGYIAGSNLTTGSNNNIMIGNSGVAGDSGTIRIGAPGLHTTTHLRAIVVIDGGTDANLANGSGYMVVGDELDLNLVIDNNEIMARDGGVASKLLLNKDSLAVVVPSLEITGGADLAEPFDFHDASGLEPGMVVAIDRRNPGQLRISDTSYDRAVAGIISGANGINAGLTLNQEGSIADGSHPVALTGRVYALADASSGRIEPGDLLTTSDTPGHLMKVTDHPRAQGAILGKAMTTLEGGTGMVLVLVSLQ